MLLLPSFHNFILSVYCDLFMGFSERVNVQCSIGKIKTAGKPGRARLSTVGVPLSLARLTNIISMQMIWAQQVKIMQYHIFCATPVLSNESVPREGRDANAEGGGPGGHWAKWAPGQWRSRPLTFCDPTLILSSVSGNHFPYYLSEIMDIYS